MTLVQSNEDAKRISLHGIQLPLSEHDVSHKIWEAILEGNYEAREVLCLRKLLDDGDRVLELGSGLGVTSTAMAKSADVQIWSFDANPQTIALAERVVASNGVTNVRFKHGLLSSGVPMDHVFYLREDFWMSSLFEAQGPYKEKIRVSSSNLDDFILAQKVNVLVMDIEGGELDLLSTAELPGIDRVFLELHDHLYGLKGVRKIFGAMEQMNFSYDPRSSIGSCVLFRRDDGQVRAYEDDLNFGTE